MQSSSQGTVHWFWVSEAAHDPHFLYKLDEFKQLVKDFSDVADFLVVYLAEAHATGNGNNISNNWLLSWCNSNNIGWYKLCLEYT